MNLTEPQAGSDLGALTTRAERQADGTYRLFGQKIFITYGEHDLAENIVHLVLARLPDAPAGSRGISLFLVPKFLLDAAGKPGERNDVFCSRARAQDGHPRLAHLHHDLRRRPLRQRAGRGRPGWSARRIAALNCMFTMMNNARLMVGIQGVGLAELALQQATAYALERRQGRAPGWSGEGMSPIADASRRAAHADDDARPDRGEPRHLLRLRLRRRHGGAAPARRAGRRAPSF